MNKPYAPLPNKVTKTLIVVERCWQWDYAGMLLNPYLPEPICFSHSVQAITSMDAFFDKIHYPQPTFERRSFFNQRTKSLDRFLSPPTLHRYHDEDLFQNHVGGLASFFIEVRSRHNASWQGEFCWVETHFHQRFRSELELMRMMGQAVFLGAN